MYLLKIALRPWKQAPASQVLTAAAVGLLVFLMGFLLWLDRGLAPVLERMDSESVVTVYLSPTVAAGEEKKVADAVSAALGGGLTARVVGRKDFVGDLQGPYPQLAEQLMELGTEMTAVVPRYITVSGRVGEDAVARARGVQGVAEVELSKGKLSQLSSAFVAVRWLARALLVGLFAVMLSALGQLARLNAHTLSDAVSLLRLWGGGSFSTRLPAVLSGAAAGVASGILAMALWIWASHWLSGEVRALSPVLQDLSLPAWKAPWFMLGVAGAASVAAALMAGIGTGRSSSGSGR